MSDSGYHLGDGLAANVDGRLVGHMADEGVRHPVDDIPRAARPSEPPVPGAQWDEMHQRWEHWDDDAQAWVVVGDAGGDGIDPADEVLLPAHLARVAHAADDLDEVPPVVIEHRQPEPGDAPKGAQWNEVVGRWERWDDAAGAWVEATAANDPPAD